MIEEGGGLSNKYLRICLCFVTPFEVGMVVEDLQASLIKHNKELHINDMKHKKKKFKIIIPQVSR